MSYFEKFVENSTKICRFSRKLAKNLPIESKIIQKSANLVENRTISSKISQKSANSTKIGKLSQIFAKCVEI